MNVNNLIEAIEMDILKAEIAREHHLNTSDVPVLTSWYEGKIKGLKLALSYIKDGV